jgi:hypothetical protein
VQTLDTPTFTQERLLGLFTSAPRAFWRHDVDVSLSAAAKMARFAELAGVQSTFYLNPRSDFYNVFSREGRAAVKAITEAGHRVGLHCDYLNGSIENWVRYDLDLLNAGYPGVFAKCVSFHMPPPRVLWRDFYEFDSAYASEWEGRYLSDSRREFGVEKGVRLALEGNDLQINLHPEHWFASA